MASEEISGTSSPRRVLGSSFGADHLSVSSASEPQRAFRSVPVVVSARRAPLEQDEAGQ
jgi:hypothetical protein